MTLVVVGRGGKRRKNKRQRNRKQNRIEDIKVYTLTIRSPQRSEKCNITIHCERYFCQVQMVKDILEITLVKGVVLRIQCKGYSVETKCKGH
ncbi:hypothetical protein CHS0354_036848, partial [Potamilus streckersoni]